MGTDIHFKTRKPHNHFLSTIIDNYFYIDGSVRQLSVHPEYIIPFPRITFGYFFNHPFKVTNLTRNETMSAKMVISRISTHRITVEPETDRINIIGAHVRPFCLAYLTKRSIRELPWLINTSDLFPEASRQFKERIALCNTVDEMFNEVETVFLDSILVRDLSIITKAIELIENHAGAIEIRELSNQLEVSDRTVRNQFYDCLGCSPKEFIRVVKMKQVAFQMSQSDRSLTHIAHDNNYFDQAHLVHEVKNITGHAPNQLRKKMPHFRFLQF